MSCANMKQPHFKVENPKGNKNWVCRPVKEEKSYKYLSVMLEDVVKAKQDAITATETLKSMPQNIARKAKLPV